MLRRLLPRWILAALLLMTGGCFGYHAVNTAPHPGTRVRVVLRTASNIAIANPSGTFMPQDGVLELSGSVRAASADTLVLGVAEVRTAAGTVGVAAGSVALVPSALVARMEQRQFRAGPTALAGIGFATIAVGAFLAFVIVTMTQGT